MHDQLELKRSGSGLGRVWSGSGKILERSGKGLVRAPSAKSCFLDLPGSHPQGIQALMNSPWKPHYRYASKQGVPKRRPLRGLRKHDSHTEAAPDLSQTAQAFPDPYQILTRPLGTTMRIQMENAMDFAMDF